MIMQKVIPRLKQGALTHNGIWSRIDRMLLKKRGVTSIAEVAPFLSFKMFTQIVFWIGVITKCTFASNTCVTNLLIAETHF